MGEKQRSISRRFCLSYETVAFQGVAFFRYIYPLPCNWFIVHSWITRLG